MNELLTAALIIGTALLACVWIASIVLAVRR